MKFFSTAAALLATAAATAQASLLSGNPDLEIKASFGAANPYSQVVNGKTNPLNLVLINHSSKELTVKYVSGAFREIGGKEKYLRNTTTAKYNINLPPSPNNAPVPLTYGLHSEAKPQDLNLVVWVDYALASDAKKTYREVAYEGQVTIVEQPGSWFDPALLLVYIILFGLTGLIGMIVFNTYVADRKRTNPVALWFRGPDRKTTRAPAPVVGLADKIDNSEWIPDHHKPSAKKGKSAKSDGEATSGNESAGGARKRVASSAKGKGKAQ